MITSELISYIKKQTENNVSKDLIISKLVGVGWHREDIDEGFSSIELVPKPAVPLSDIKKEVDKVDVIENKPEVIVDKYREIPIEDNTTVEIKKELPIIETPKIEIPRTETPKVELPKTEVPKIETPKVESPKVWTPMSVPVKEKEQTSSVNPDIKIEPVKPVIQNPELQIKKEELIPTLTPKVVGNSFGPINKDNSIKPDVPVSSNEAPKISLINNLPKIAMLSSYQNDLLSINKKEEEMVQQKKGKVVKWLIVVSVIFIIALIAAIVSGYINIKDLNITFIKKDPKVLLLNNSKVLSSLGSYKTETNIEISSPSFSNITNGLVSGEPVSSLDKDFISIKTLGIINKSEKGIFSDNLVTIKSSLWQDPITTDIKNNGLDLFVSVPDLSQIIKENIPEPSVLKINENQFDLITPLFSSNTELALKKINTYKILSNGILSYINNETLSAYNDFINNVEIVEKDQENIKGTDTYHYSVNVDRQLAKNLLSKISNDFVLDLSDNDKDKLSQILGSITVSSFDIWIGKGDNNIYQYSVILDIPLSKIISFEDKSIGDNKVNVTWKTTYYDFNIVNSVSIPEKFTPVVDFVNDIKKTRIKNDVSSFKQLANNLKNAGGVYGSKSNTKGDCMNPSSGSLFSPVGHIKGAATAISSISELLNKILKTTNGNGVCYSTSKAWSFTVPISDNYDPSSVPASGYQSFFCVDSTGATQDLAVIPTGTVCSPKTDATKVGN